MKLFNIILIPLILCCHNTIAKETPKPQTISLATIKLSKNIYMLKGEGGFFGGNVGLSIGNDGAILIDNGIPEHLALLKKSIADITQHPVTFLINTHIHDDHIGNNAAYGVNNAYIVGHEKLRQSMLNKDNDILTQSLPVITFPNHMTFHLNEQTTKIQHLPNAHTDGDAIIHFKEANVIHAGDLFFNGLFPFVDSSNGGNYGGYIMAQQAIIAIANNETKIIPGHGPLANRQDLQNSVDMLINCRDIISKLIKQGKSLEQIIELNPLREYQSWHWGFITTEKMIQQIITDLD